MFEEDELATQVMDPDGDTQLFNLGDETQVMKFEAEFEVINLPNWKRKGGWSDALYVQLCLMVRDMSVNVRIEAFKALGRVAIASNSVLVQTLSKKVLPYLEEKKFQDQLSGKHSNLPALSAARAFIHVLEDEFFEVRSSACYSLRMPTIHSADFAAEALDLLMDVLNDNLTIVRLQVLETMHHMAVFGHLKVKEMHMHMLLGTLVDMNSSIRCTPRKVLRLTKLHDLPMFKIVADSLIQSLEIFPQDKPDVLSLLFEIGRSHGSFAGSITKEIFLEIDPSSESTWDINSSKTTAHHALAISAPLSYGRQQHLYSIPSIIFPYAVTMLGRLYIALNEVMNQDTLIAYLSHCSRFGRSIARKLFVEDALDDTQEANMVYQSIEWKPGWQHDSVISLATTIKLEQSESRPNYLGALEQAYSWEFLY